MPNKQARYGNELYRMPRTAANFENESRAFEAYYGTLIVGKYGLRAGELLHLSPNRVRADGYDMSFPPA